MSRPRIGIFMQNLSAHRPRGVARVARALAEALVEDRRIATFAVAEPEFDRVDIVAQHYDLREYLDAIPLVLPVSETVRAAWHDGLRRLGRRAARIFRPLMHPPYDAYALRIARVFGLYRPGRYVYRHLSRILFPPPPRSLLEGAVETGALTPLGSTTLERFDVLLSFEIYESIWDWPIEALRPRTLCVVHDMLPLRIEEGAGWQPDRFFRVVGKAVTRADRLVCVSGSTERDLLDFFPVAAGKTCVVHNGHDLERFARARRAPGAGDADGFTILMLGDIDRRKNVHNVYLALAELGRRIGGRPVTLQIVGNAARRDEFAALEAIGARHATIAWLGYVDDDALPGILAAADCFLFPSLWEGFGIPVLEAMSAGVPVVCSELSSLPEVAGGHAVLCDPYDPVSIAEALARVATMGAEERAARVAAAARWAARFTWKSAAMRLAEEILREAASATRRPGEARRVALPGSRAA